MNILSILMMITCTLTTLVHNAYGGNTIYSKMSELEYDSISYQDVGTVKIGDNSGVLQCKTENQGVNFSEFRSKRELAAGTRLSPINFCICKENFTGRTCEDCAHGYYGSDCLPCKRNPVDSTICGVDGICDDGVKGSGKCICKNHDHDPEKFCESSSNIKEEK